MKKGYKLIVKAIKVTKKYNEEEIKLLSGLFSYLNKIDVDEEGFGTGVSAKGLWRLLNPLTRTGKKQAFREWWESVSNLSRLKEGKDYQREEKIIMKNISNKPSFAGRENSQKAKRGGNTGILPVKEIDYIKPKTRDNLKDLIKDFLNKEVKIINIEN